MELYIATDDAQRVAESILSKMPRAEGGRDGLYVKKNLEAIAHLFRVASGLDSLVVGEEQILQQIKAAGAKARVSGNARSILSSLFDAAFNVGRRVRASYDVTLSNKSVSAFALQFALKKLGRRPRKILLIGTGETARLAATQLKGAKIYLASRRKDALRLFPNATVVSYRQLRRLAWDGDMVISATKHSGYVIKKGDIVDKGKVVFLDLAFPRNIDPAFKTSRFSELYDLDDLAIHARSMHQDMAFAASEKLIREEAERFTHGLVASRLSPTLANIYRWAEDIRSSETQVALRKLSNLSERERSVVEAMSRSLVSKLIAPHASFVKQPSGEITQVEKLRLLEGVFGPEATR
jgi:glutamyl-tRNA reductase